MDVYREVGEANTQRIEKNQELKVTMSFDGKSVRMRKKKELKFGR